MIQTNPSHTKYHQEVFRQKLPMFLSPIPAPTISTDISKDQRYNLYEEHDGRRNHRYLYDKNFRKTNQEGLESKKVFSVMFKEGSGEEERKKPEKGMGMKRKSEVMKKIQKENFKETNPRLFKSKNLKSQERCFREDRHYQQCDGSSSMDNDSSNNKENIRGKQNLTQPSNIRLIGDVNKNDNLKNQNILYRMLKAEQAITRSKVRMQELQSEERILNIKTQPVSRNTSINKSTDPSLNQAQKLVNRIQQMLEVLEGRKMGDVKEVWRLLKKKVRKAERVDRMARELEQIIKDKEIIRTEDIREWMRTFN